MDGKCGCFIFVMGFEVWGNDYNRVYLSLYYGFVLKFEENV